MYRADIADKNEIYETVLNIAYVVDLGGGVKQIKFGGIPFISVSKEPKHNFRTIGQPLLG
jgi:hypothetical protein